MKAHPSQSYTLASRSKSRHTDQNLPKSMPARTHGGQDIAAKLIEFNNERQKRPVANKRYKTLGFKRLCKHSAPHQSSVSGDSDVARNPQRFHTADRCVQPKKTTVQQ